MSAAKHEVKEELNHLLEENRTLRETCEELLKKWWEEAGRCLSADCLVCKRNAQDKARFEAVLAQAEKKE